jgi:hypothetical protein
MMQKVLSYVHVVYTLQSEPLCNKIVFSLPPQCLECPLPMRTHLPSLAGFRTPLRVHNHTRLWALVLYIDTPEVPVVVRIQSAS